MKKTLKNWLTAYLSSFKTFGRYRWKILWMILIDVGVVFLLYLLFMFTYGSVVDQYMNEMVPLAQKASLLKEAQNDEEADIAYEKLFTAITPSGDPKAVKRSMRWMLTLFVGKMILALLGACVIIALSRAAIWSMIKDIFSQPKMSSKSNKNPPKNRIKTFFRFFWYDLIWVLAGVIIFAILFFLTNLDAMIKISTPFVLVFVYFSVILKMRYEQKDIIFKQISQNLSHAIKSFIYYLGGIILLALTLAVLTLILTPLKYVLPEMAMGIFSIVMIFLVITWARIFFYSTMQKWIG